MWPKGIRCAVCLTFDFDAESLYLGYMERLRFEGDRRQFAQTLTPISRGQYGTKVGIVRVLRFLEKHAIPGTFFVPGLTADLYPDTVREIARQGHELANHGYYHENPTEFIGDLEKETSILRRANDTLERLCGVRPVGYRSPGWDLNPYTPEILLKEGMLYDSSLMDQEKPYLLFEEEKSKLIELPIDWLLDDYVHFQFSPPSIPGLSAPSKVLEIWRGEFEGYLEDGGCFTLTMHPQVIGRSHRMQMLDQLVRYMKEKPGVWFATCGDVARHWADRD
ncbi:MAG: polysaccharide deacetylase [Deltaproteobacteria bacterium]|nr:polysaccharide deacetylase [Deltaproteobacteria bacterium]